MLLLIMYLLLSFIPNFTLKKSLLIVWHNFKVLFLKILIRLTYFFRLLKTWSSNKWKKKHTKNLNEKSYWKKLGKLFFVNFFFNFFFSKKILHALTSGNIWLFSTLDEETLYIELVTDRIQSKCDKDFRHQYTIKLEKNYLV